MRVDRTTARVVVTVHLGQDDIIDMLRVYFKSPRLDSHGIRKKIQMPDDEPRIDLNESDGSLIVEWDEPRGSIKVDDDDE